MVLIRKRWYGGTRRDQEGDGSEQAFDPPVVTVVRVVTVVTVVMVVTYER